MPLYHFDLVHGNNHLDAVDAEASDDIKAMDCAESIARRILRIWPDAKNHHYSILVTDHEGEEICRLPIDIIH